MVETAVVIVVVALALLVVVRRARRRLSGQGGCVSCRKCGPREMDAHDPPNGDK